MITSTTYQYLERNPKSSYTQLWVRGARVRARTLYGLFAGPDAMQPEEIAEDYAIPLEAVHEAIAYCKTNPPEIDEDRRHEEAVMKATGACENGGNAGERTLLTPQERASLRRG
jgi:uncharacterized protein (DUF433 family)